MANGNRQYPTGRAGNYSAPVDTTGMDSEMKSTLGFSDPSAQKTTPPPGGRMVSNPIMEAFRRAFHTPRAKLMTPEAKSGSVNRTSDIPTVQDVQQGTALVDKMIAADKAKSASVRIKRTSDRPVMKVGQGIQGNRHDVKSGSGMGIK